MRSEVVMVTAFAWALGACGGEATPTRGTDATLAALALSDGTLTPSFASAVTSYRVSIPAGTPAVAVTVTASDPDARIRVTQDGGASVEVTSGGEVAGLGVPAADGMSLVAVQVTAADGVTTTTYRMLWELGPAVLPKAALSGLSLSAGVLRPFFSPGTLAYDATVPADTTTFTVTPVVAHDGAQVTVSQDGATGVPVTSGAASPPLAAPAAGATTTIDVTVVASDGQSSLTYEVVLSSASPAVGAPDPKDWPDGWASVSAPSSPGGAAATPDHVYTVHSRSELVAALAAGGTTPSAVPKVVYVDGTIDLSVDANDQPLGGWDYLAQAGYGSKYATYAAFQAAFVAGCTNTSVDAAREDERRAAQAKQKLVVAITVPSNTSILGVGSTAVIKNGQLTLKGVDNVVIRNVSVQDAYDYFPLWDTSEDLFNSDYDLIHVEGATHVWVDHCELSDGARPDSTEDVFTIGGASKKWVVHDGALDVTNGASYITVSYNYVHDHDKTHLVGSSDTKTSDAAYLKTTFHHNHYSGARQRLPRVRFGQVHVYNNYYEQVASYAIGVGVAARIWSESNYFDGVSRPITTSFSTGADPGYCYDTGSFGVSGASGTASQVGWVPSEHYSYVAGSAEAAKASVLANSGVGKF